MPGAFFAVSPSSAASVFESNKSVTLTFYSVLSGALGANFKKIKLFCVVGLHAFSRRGIFFLSLRFFKPSRTTGLFFDVRRTGGLDKRRGIAERFFSPHAWGWPDIKGKGIVKISCFTTHVGMARSKPLRHPFGGDLRVSQTLTPMGLKRSGRKIKSV